MRHYKTKTGVYMHCLNGEGLGDQIPRGKLHLVKTEKSQNRFFDWLFNKQVFFIKIGPFEYRSEAA